MLNIEWGQIDPDENLRLIIFHNRKNVREEMKKKKKNLTGGFWRSSSAFNTDILEKKMFIIT